MCIYTYIHMYIYIYICMYVCIYIYIYTYTSSASRPRTLAACSRSFARLHVESGRPRAVNHSIVCWVMYNMI